MFPLGAALAGDPYSAYAKSFQTATDQVGQQMAGQAVQQLFNIPMPGAQQMPSQGQAPGQTPPPSQGGFLTRLFGGQQQTPGMPPSGAPAMPMSGGAPQQAPAPAPTPAASPVAAPPQQQGGGQNPIGNMTFPQIVQGLVRSNPGASPAQIFSALRQMAPAMVPFMNADALAQYRNAMIAQGGERLRQGEERIDVAREGQQQRAQTAAAGQDVRGITAAIGAITARIQSGQDDGSGPEQLQHLVDQLQSRGRGGGTRPQGPAQTAVPSQGPPQPGAAPPPPGAAPPQPGAAPPPPPQAAMVPQTPQQAAGDPQAMARQQLVGNLQRAYAGGGGPQGAMSVTGATPTPGAPTPMPGGYAPQAGMAPQIAQSGTGAPANPIQINKPPQQAPAPASVATAPPPQQIPRPGALPAGATPITQTDRRPPDKTDNDKYATAVEEGLASPSLREVGAAKGRRGNIAEILAKRGVNLPQMQEQERAAQQLARTSNTEKKLRTLETIRTMGPEVDRLRDLSKQMDLGQYHLINWARLRALDASGDPTARQYIFQLATLKEKYSAYVNSNFAPTSNVWKLVNGQLDANFGFKEMSAALDELKRTTSYQEKAMRDVAGGLLPGGQNPYVPQQQPATEGGGDGIPRPPLNARPNGTFSLPPGVKIERIN